MKIRGLLLALLLVLIVPSPAYGATAVPGAANAENGDFIHFRNVEWNGSRFKATVDWDAEANCSSCITNIHLAYYDNEGMHYSRYQAAWSEGGFGVPSSGEMDVANVDPRTSHIQVLLFGASVTEDRIFAISDLVAAPQESSALIAASALLGTLPVDDLCVSLNEMPGATHYRGLSVSDQYQDCITLIKPGTTSADLVTLLLAWDSGEGIIRYIFGQEFPLPSKPPRGGSAGGGNTGGGQSTPPTKRQQVENGYDLARVIESVRASVPSLPSTTVEIVARACVKEMSLIREEFAKCATTPIFVTANEAREATRHDISALSVRDGHPEWAKLNYLTKPKNPQWYAREPECAGKRSRAWHCDEFPFWSTLQGGGDAHPRPSLRIIKGADNIVQGNRLGSFIRRCKLQSHDQSPQGSLYLVVALKHSLKIQNVPPICPE
ncbi:hypothetical protein KIH74_35585 [Kineosporia sp. J2-2]|uniref:Deoxyribonuclease NucA/NucB domain-containing protein n=1 Tax=Kineosporia corallincola TaxID=2835133 RepID=A0ABS5TU35_9ACTN|nr:hypothetical protein [Kineosporia corallincola]MBT0774319.1 hypothetical protein [Kineosporia corallincola]